MAHLYRGVCDADDERNGGALRPKGSSNAVTMHRDGTVRERKGQFERVASENNAVRAHHIESGLYGGCWVSFTRVEKVACHFATSGGMEDGYVFVVDEGELTAHGVVMKEFDDPENPGEVEVSLRASDNGDLPADIVVEKRRVFANDV
ncbi:hypothetical protein [Polaromonas sp. JS666]|uniref:hypothetical protein n=1 Tax=Polaromonas sp. (strain JS666 / ATCC BAA-500) TaxID=296591 RepID=UPI00087EA6E0|nr:hypothetical protein [Polaromonas sp. JS666]SDO07422.1 hypothetical protein SAMN05720382_11334 [Polaromonas sp. JS666]